jgi:hypothetical protein
MKNFATKGLVAAAVATACATILPGNVANASTIVAKLGGAENYSREGLAASASSVVVSLAPISFVTGNTLFNGDRYRLTLSAGTAAGAGNSNPVTDVECGTNGSGDFKLEFQSFSGSSVTYLVKNVSGATNGKSCAFLSLGVQASSISTASTVTLRAEKAPFGSQTFNEDTAAAALMLSTAAQYTLSLQAAFNGTVDYTATNSGLNFTAEDILDTATGNSDVLQIKLQSANLLNSVGTAGSVRFVVTAAKDFKFLDNNGDGICTAADTSVTVARGVFTSSSTGSTAATYSINEACTQITVESSGAVMPVVGAEYTLSLAMGRNAAAASVTTGIRIEPQDFANTSVLVTRTSTGTQSTATYDAGVWDQNGASYVIPYMPYNSSATARIDPTVYVTNRGATAASVTASARNESGTACTDMALGTVNATSTRNVGPSLATALDTCYGAGTAQRLYITINIATAAGNTEVYSGFNVIGSGRGTVVNSSNGRP